MIVLNIVCLVLASVALANFINNDDAGLSAIAAFAVAANLFAILVYIMT